MRLQIQIIVIFYEENRRPINSLFHLGQYQSNQFLLSPTTWANGGPLDDDEEDDGTADSSSDEDVGQG